MPKKTITLLFLFLSLALFSQTSESNKNRASLERCSLLENSNRTDCYIETLQRILFDEISKKYTNFELPNNSKLKTEMEITLTKSGIFKVDIIKSADPKIDASIVNKFASFENIFPVEDKKGNSVEIKFSTIFIINVDAEGKIGLGLKKQQIEGFEEEQNLPFDIIEKVPVFPGCNGNTNEELRNCLSKNITNHVIKEFNFSIVKKLDLPKGLTRIYVNFKIDKRGKVIDVVAKADHERLEKEAIRVLNKVPRMEPGEQKGKPVGVLYSLPIVLQVE